MPLTVIRQFLKLETASGVILLFAAILALVVDNSPLSSTYQRLISAILTFHSIGIDLSGSTLFWVNEGLMTFFFLLVGLELKREFVDGELSHIKQVMLPGVAALGGMLIPALFYIAINHGNLHALRGWAVPVATDIAFALGVLSLFGQRVPLGLKLFLLALAIFDDIGAIVIIALFYSEHLAWIPLCIGMVIVLAMFCLNRLSIKAGMVYFLLGILLWGCILRSGIHASIVGVLVALVMPVNRALEAKLHPWIAFLIMPLFAFTNAGISFASVDKNILFSPITWGVIAGLVLGKQIGVFSAAWLFVKLKWASIPKGTTWLQFYGVALLCGIGFTMSLFLGTLAFQNDQPMYLVEVRLGVLLGSIISGVMGAMMLHMACKKVHRA